MKALLLILLLPFAVGADQKKEGYLNEKLLPLAREFMSRNQLGGAAFATNKVTFYKIDFFEDRAGASSSMTVGKRYTFNFHEENGVIDLTRFQDEQARSSFLALGKGDTDQVMKAVRELSKKDKLTEVTALALAKKFFLLQGHKEENFHPPTFRQRDWGGKNDPDIGHFLLPFYTAGWNRKDMKEQDLIAHPKDVSWVQLAISGIDSTLTLYYKKNLGLGFGYDFEFEPVGEKEKEFFSTKLLPTIREFIRKTQMPMDSNFTTNQITECKVQFPYQGATARAWITLNGEYRFAIVERNGKCEVERMTDILYENYGHFEADIQGTLIDQKKALSLAEKFWKSTKHSEDFEFLGMKRAIRDERLPLKDMEREPLLLDSRLYEAKWQKQETLINGQRMLHAGRIQISALTAKVVLYERFLSDDDAVQNLDD